MLPEDHDVTQLLRQWSDGNQEALQELLPIIYEELRRVAHQSLHRDRDEQTLQTTALVHEAYIKLIDQRSVNWQNRAHFFAIAAQAIGSGGMGTVYLATRADEQFEKQVSIKIVKRGMDTEVGSTTPAL